MEETFNFGAEKPKESGADISALAEKIAELSAENERLKAEAKQLRQDNDEAAAAVERAEALAKDKADWKSRAEIAEGEAATLKAALDRAEKSLAEIGRKSEKVFQPFEDVMKNFRSATQLVNGIKDDAAALNRAAAEAKAAREQYRGEPTWKDVVLSALKYCAIGAFLFGFAYFGTVKGGMADEISFIRDLASRIAYNQYFAPWGIEPINPFISGDTATKIWNDTYKNWLNQQKQQQPI